MSKLENICVSLDLAKQLKEAGYPQESLFVWGQRKYPTSIAENKWFDPDLFYLGEEGLKVLCVAPTASEIGEKFGGHLSIDKTDKGRWVTKYWWGEEYTGLRDGHITDWHMEAENNLCDSLAKMWLYLKENNLLEII